MDRRKNRTHSNLTLPVGTIRYRRDEAGPWRAIKVCMGGPRGTRWLPLGTYLYRQAYGPVPRGMRVIHLDGNRLNCELSNLRAVRPGDVAYLGMLNKSSAQREIDKRNCARGTARSNRERAIARRLLGEILPAAWYAVDHVARTVTGPYRRLYRIFAAHGMHHPTGSLGDRSSWVGVQLGWPGLARQSSLVLAALADAGEPLFTPDLLERINLLASRIGLPGGITARMLHPANMQLRSAGLLELSRRNPRRIALRRITPMVLAQRGPTLLVAPMRGRDVLPLIGEYRLVSVMPEKQGGQR